MNKIASALLVFMSFASSLAPAEEPVKLRSLAPQPVAVQRETVNFRMSYDVKAGSRTSLVDLTVLIPQTLAQRQIIRRMTFSHTPTRIFEADGNKYAQFTLVEPKGHTLVTVDVEADLHQFDYSTALADVRADGEPRLEYLAAERYLEKDDGRIRAAAAGVVGETLDQTLRGLFRYVVQTIRPVSYQAPDVGALRAMETRRGDCTEYADLLVALCRSRNIPARFSEGYITKHSTMLKHDWVEIFLPQHGWVPFDPALTRVGLASFEKMEPIYICLSNVRNDRTLANGHYWFYRYLGDAIKVTDDFSVGGMPALTAVDKRN